MRHLILDKKPDVADLGSSSTFHMRNKLEPTSYDAIKMLLALALKFIKQRLSLRENLKSEIMFLRTFGAPEPIRYLNDTLKVYYTSVAI